MKNARRVMSLMAVAIVAASLPLSAAEDEDESCEFDSWYVGASATLVMPQGGHGMRRLGGATARFGHYFTEALSVEADAAWLENCAGLGVQGLWHFYGYDGG